MSKSTEAVKVLAVGSACVAGQHACCIASAQPVIHAEPVSHVGSREVSTFK